jgi:hypothetical protein
MSTTTTPTLPSEEELDAAHRALTEVIEEHFEEIPRRIFAVTNADEPRVSYADVGLLCACVRDFRILVRWLDEELGKVERSTMNDLTVIARDGHMPNVPQYDELGRPNYPALRS